MILPVQQMLTTATHYMKHILSDDERKFLLEPLESDGKSQKQKEYLEGGKAILSALKTLYPQGIETYFALFLIFSIINPLEMRFNSNHEFQLVLLLATISSNIFGLYLLRRNDTGWMDRGIAILRAGELPTKEIYQHLLTTFAAALFLLPGLLFSVIGLALLIVPLQKKFALLLQQIIGNKFASL